MALSGRGGSSPLQRMTSRGRRSRTRGTYPLSDGHGARSVRSRVARMGRGWERTYAEAMEAWTSNCPRHPAWDDASGEGLIRVVRGHVELTELGLRRLDDVRRTLYPSVEHTFAETRVRPTDQEAGMLTGQAAGDLGLPDRVRRPATATRRRCARSARPSGSPRRPPCTPTSRTSSGRAPASATRRSRARSSCGRDRPRAARGRAGRDARAAAARRDRGRRPAARRAERRGRTSRCRSRSRAAARSSCCASRATR